MKSKIIFCFVFLATIAFAQATTVDHPETLSPGDPNFSSYSWGEPEKGLRLGASQIKTNRADGSLDLLISIQNISEGDLVLNLGIMLANGKNQYPNALYLLLKNSDGHIQKLGYVGPRSIMGRMDPFVVPLAAGATYTLRCGLNSFSGTASGTVELVVGFEGKSVTMQEENGDMKGLSLMPYWVGTLKSDGLSITVPR